MARLSRRVLRRRAQVTRSEARPFRINRDIRLTEEQHKKLLDWIKERLEFGNLGRASWVDRLKRIDQQVHAYMRLSEDDRKREIQNIMRGDLKPTDMVLQLIWLQLDEEVTYLLQVFAPDMDMFEAVARPDEQDAANAFALVNNKAANRQGYYRQYSKFFINALKYNLGMKTLRWVVESGPNVRTSPTGLPQNEEEEIWAGNDIESLDLYNTLWDQTVHPIDLCTKGEFFATIHPISKFQLKRMVDKLEIEDYEKNIINNNGISPLRLYQEHPTLSVDYGDQNTTGKPVNWVHYMSGGTKGSVGPAHEEVRFYCWLVPNDFDLGPNKKLELWKFYIIDGKVVVGGIHLDNQHNMLPVVAGSPIEDDNGLQVKSPAEMLAPLQRYASHQINVSQRGARKALYNTIFYDPLVVDLEQQDAEETGRYKVLMPGDDRDIRKHVMIVTDTPQTLEAAQEVERVMSLMQRLMPTDVVGQITSLERATQYQAAATVQGTTRRGHKTARLLHAQAFSKLYRMMHSNILQYQRQIEVPDPKTGEMTPMDPAEFRMAQLEYSISDGLKGIDRLMVVESLKEVFMALLQTPQAWERADIFGMLDYWSSLLGDRADLTRFKYKSPIDALPPDQKQMAFQLFQEAVAKAQEGQAGGARPGSGPAPAGPPMIRG